MTRDELKTMNDSDIAVLLDNQPTSYARECIVSLLISARHYDRSVLHAALGFCRYGSGGRHYGSLIEHLRGGSIDPAAVRFLGRGWHADKPRRRSGQRNGRGRDLGFSVRGSEIKRIILEDGLCPKLRTSAKGLV